MVTKGIMAILFFLIIPELLGLFILFFKKNKIRGKRLLPRRVVNEEIHENQKLHVILALIIGYIIEFALLEVMSLVTIKNNYELSKMINLFMNIVGGISVLSFLLNLKRMFYGIKYIFKEILETPKILALIAIALILFQISFYVRFMHTDTDDAFYVGVATASLWSNSLYQISPGTGEGSFISANHSYGPFPTYYAVAASVVGTHPAIIAHFILPIIFVPLVYLVYFELGKELCENKKTVFTFLIFMCIVNIFGNFSIRNNFTFFLIRIWQGKSMLANFILPATILFMLKADRNNYNFSNWLVLILLNLAGVFTTTMSIGFCTITIMLLGFSFEIARFNIKNIKYSFINLVKCFICCMPSLIIGLEYLKSKG